MSKRLVILFLFLFCLSCGWLDAAETVIQEKPVRIVTSSDPNIFPANWLSQGIQAWAERLPDNQFVRTRTILNRAQKKYPPEVLEKNLKTIYALHRLVFRSISASGTNGESNVYIANRGVRAGFTDSHIERTCHAELSSLLLKKYPQHLDTKTWRQVNAESFKYERSGVTAVRKKKSSKTFDACAHDKGFLHEYAQSTLENDFNSIAEQLFMGNQRFWRVVAAYPKIKAKADLTIAFYQRIDPAFNQAFFKLLINLNKTRKPRGMRQMQRR